jgi:nicotinamidase-related amidase
MDEATERDYQQVGFGRSTEFGAAPAVVVVDMCKAYFQDGSPLNLDRPDVADAVGQVVTAARSARVPIIWTRVEYEPGGADGGVWYRKVGALSSFDRGNPLGHWLDGLEPVDGETVITKKHASGFAGTDLAQRLNDLGADTVIVVGVSTSGCVRATATDASAAGYLPFVVKEAVGDRTPQIENANLFDLHAKYADVVSLTDVLSHIAGH